MTSQMMETVKLLLVLLIYDHKIEFVQSHDISSQLNGQFRVHSTDQRIKSTIKSVQVKNLMDCHTQCILHNDLCQSYNFMDTDKICELSADTYSEENDMEQLPGWVHYERDTSPKYVGKPCVTKSPCPERDYCVSTCTFPYYKCMCKNTPAVNEKSCTKENLCENGGICVETCGEDGHRCKCPSRYHGKNCQIDLLDACSIEKSCYPCHCSVDDLDNPTCDCSNIPINVFTDYKCCMKSIAINPNTLAVHFIGTYAYFYIDTTKYQACPGCSRISAPDPYLTYATNTVSILFKAEKSWTGTATATTQPCQIYTTTATDLWCLDNGLISRAPLDSPDDFVIVEENADVGQSIQIRHDVLYAIRNKGIVAKNTLTDNAQWETITHGNIIDFKINFNGEIFAIGSSRQIFKWNGEKWDIVMHRFCNDFDVNHLIVCNDDDTHTYANVDYIPPPNYHIPFDTYETKSKTTYYSIGVNMNNDKRIELDNQAQSIAYDQFGKGLVLHLTDVLALGLSTVDRFFKPVYGDGYLPFTIALSVRFTEYDTNFQYIDIFEYGRASIIYENIDSDTLRVVMKVYDYKESPTDPGEYQLTEYGIFHGASIPKTSLHDWTQLVLSWNGEGILQGFINGTKYDEDTSASVTNTTNYVGVLYGGSLTCQGSCFISNFAVWHAIFEENQITKLYEQDKTNPNMDPSLVKVDAQSCDELQKHYQGALTYGSFWIQDVDGKTIVKECDFPRL